MYFKNPMRSVYFQFGLSGMLSFVQVTLILGNIMKIILIILIENILFLDIYPISVHKKVNNEWFIEFSIRVRMHNK